MRSLAFLIILCLLGVFSPVMAQKKMPKDAGTLPSGVNRQPAPNNSMRRNAPVFPESKKPVDSAALAAASAPVVQATPAFEQLDSAFISATGRNLIIIRQNNLEGIANDTGKIILAPAYDRISFFNNKDSSCTRWEGILKVQKGGAVGLIHYNGKPITVLDYQDISLLPASCSGTHPASMVAKVKQLGKFGLINGKGEVLIRPSYDDVLMLADEQGKATNPEIVLVRRQNKYGMMELRNGQVLKTEFERIEFLQHLEKEVKGKTEKELLLRLKINGKWGFLNISDKFQSQPEWDEILPFSNGWAAVRKGDEWGFINEEGKNKISCQYEATLGFRQGGAPVRKNGKWGVINADKKEVFALQADQMEFLVQPESKRRHSDYVLSLVKIERNGKTGVIDTQGRPIIPCEYDSLEYVPRTGGFKVTKDGKEQFVALPDAPAKK
jgi:hypothetical protein